MAGNGSVIRTEGLNKILVLVFSIIEGIPMMGDGTILCPTLILTELGKVQGTTL